jgi:hypothetical protein
MPPRMQDPRRDALMPLQIGTGETSVVRKLDLPAAEPPIDGHSSNASEAAPLA